ncbi:hypothetical protein JCM8202_000045 [Rhodotorula sphaerocarpa]
MSPDRALSGELEAAIDDLLSLRASAAQQAAALVQLEALVARVAVNSSNATPFEAFLRSQDAPCSNIAAALLDWLGRLLVRNEARSDTFEAVEPDVVRSLRVLQGLLLMHRPSQRLFERKSAFEILLALLDLSRPNEPTTPLLATPRPQPSPVMFPSTPAASPSLGASSGANLPKEDVQTQLAIAVLDTLLCGLVDRPRNTRAFEATNGLAAIVRVLKDKSVAQNVRIKVIETLFYYLLPETPTSDGAGLQPTADLAKPTSSSSIGSDFLAHPGQLPGLLSGAADFVPQTPLFNRFRNVAKRLAAQKARLSRPSCALDAYSAPPGSARHRAGRHAAASRPFRPSKRFGVKTRRARTDGPVTTRIAPDASTA